LDICKAQLRIFCPRAVSEALPPACLEQATETKLSSSLFEFFVGGAKSEIGEENFVEA